MGYATILGLDLGKFKSVCCAMDAATGGHAFETLPTAPVTIHELLVRHAAAAAGNKQWTRAGLAQLAADARPIEACDDALDLWRGRLSVELTLMVAVDAQLKLVDRKLDELAKTEPRVALLQSVRGVGPRLSEMVVAMIDDPHRFKSVRQVGAYAGLVTRRYQSGEMDRSGRISKAGCRKLRKLLVEIAWGMLRHNPHGAAVFNRISKGQRTRRKQAAVALGRRVLCWCWAMLRDGTEWSVPAPRMKPCRAEPRLSPCG